MKTSFNVEIQMLGSHERNFDLDERIGNTLGFVEDDIDERETYRLTALFSADCGLADMLSRVSALLDAEPNISYVDLLWWSGTGTLPERVVVWQDGSVQYYRTRVIYEEVK